MTEKLIPTTLVGSYPPPNWLVAKDKLTGTGPPRVRMRDVWKIPPAELEEAQDDATLTAIHDQERAGIDILSDGEVRRESYFNRFANALDGIDLDNPATVPSRAGNPTLVPRVVGEIRRAEPVQVKDVEFLRAHTDRTIKITIPGAFTMAKLALDEHYGSQEALIAAYAKVVNEAQELMKTDEPMKVRIGIGLGAWPFGTVRPGDVLDFIDRCEALDIDSIWLSDRIVSDYDHLEAVTFMDFMAARMENMMLGTSVLALPARNPVVLAKELATLDVLSGGRLLPAVGLGPADSADFQATGVRREERGRRTDEAIRLM